MQKKSIQQARRRFLKRLGVFTGAGALLALGTQSKAHAQVMADTTGADQRHKGQGYRMTPHIRSYYEKAGL